MNLFETKLNRIDDILNGDLGSYRGVEAYSSQSITKSLTESTNGLDKSPNDKVVAKVNFDGIQSLYGTHRFSFSELRIGPHPDFQHLNENEYLNHYAVSMFADIKGSTNLVKRYNLLQIRQIKDTILTLIIEVCSFFGGHIQRLQGDGVFVYFVRSEMNSKDAIINSLNAASLLAFFMNNQLPEYFKDDDIKAPKIRIGIDYGDETKTIWSYYGLTYCNELTTTGLHTDLAAKLQGAAKGNGIMLGQNVIKELDLPNNFLSQDGEDNIFDNYQKYNFEWEKYLLSFDFFKKNRPGKLCIIEPELRLICEIAEDDSEQYFPYHQNLFCIPKGFKIRFTIIENNQPYRIKNEYREEVRWEILNTGEEAKTAKKLQEEVATNNNQVECNVDAEFLGHHYMLCKIIKQGRIANINLKFPVFVQ